MMFYVLCFFSFRKLQQPGASEDELSKVLRDSEFPLLKTNNKEIAGILQNLRKMEKRLEGEMSCLLFNDFLLHLYSACYL